MNSKKNRPKFELIAKQREAERRHLRKFLAELKAESYAPAIQLELPFTYEREQGKEIPRVKVNSDFPPLQTA